MLSFLSSDRPGQRISSRAESGYGLGMMNTARESHRRIGHGGMYSGYTMGLGNISEADVTIVLLMNRGLLFEERQMLDRIAEAVMLKP